MASTRSPMGQKEERKLRGEDCQEGRERLPLRMIPILLDPGEQEVGGMQAHGPVRNRNEGRGEAWL